MNIKGLIYTASHVNLAVHPKREIREIIHYFQQIILLCRDIQNSLHFSFLRTQRNSLTNCTFQTIFSMQKINRDK